MRTSRPSLGAVLLLVAAVVWMPSWVSSQGPLTPPGAPAPTMRALNEIESRTPVQTLTGDATAQFIIAAPGAYYLTADITGVSGKSAIAINADGVTLDLSAHTITGVAGALRGIEFRGTRAGFAIRNGIIRSFDSGGVSTNGAPATNGRIESLTIQSCTPGIGFTAGSPDGVVVSECTVSGGTGNGINLTTTRGLVEKCAVNGLSGASNVVGIIANVVNSATVTNITATGGSAAQGISCSEASHCAVNAVTNAGAGAAIGISANVTTGCDVQSILATSSIATGISANAAENCSAFGVNVSTTSSSATGISAASVHNCRVNTIGTAGGAAGSPIGIAGTTVTACTVVSIGSASSLGAPVGISAQNVQNCTVQTVGSASSAVGATGVIGSNIGHTFVNSVNGGTSGTAIGINGSEVDHCNAITVGLANGTGNATGIVAEIITDSRASTVSSGASGTSAGLSGYRTARNCIVVSVSNAGSGQSYGAVTTNTGRTEAVSVSNGTNDIGIFVGSGQTVIGCTIASATTGISATGVRNVIDGNNITGSSTTGISAVSGANNANALIVRNQIRNSTTKIVNDAPCQVGPVVNATGTIASTNPWANFTD